MELQDILSSDYNSSNKSNELNKPLLANSLLA